MTGLKSTLRAGASRFSGTFACREDGSIAIETMLLLPVMLWALLFGFTVHDAFRSQGQHQKAAYALGDAVSRETASIDDAYYNGLHSAFEYLAHSQDKTEMRLSQLWYDEDADEYKSDWSQVRGGGVSPLTDSEVRLWHDKLPYMADNERVVLLETWSAYDPVFNIGLVNNEIRTFVFTRPRYAPWVCFNNCPTG